MGVGARARIIFLIFCAAAASTHWQASRHWQVTARPRKRASRCQCLRPQLRVSERHSSQTPTRATLQLRPAGRAQGAALEVVEHEQADRRRQITLLAGGVDLADQFGQRHAAYPGNLLHATPERLFETDAGLVTADNDR